MRPGESKQALAGRVYTGHIWGRAGAGGARTSFQGGSWPVKGLCTRPLPLPHTTPNGRGKRHEMLLLLLGSNLAGSRWWWTWTPTLTGEYT